MKGTSGVYGDASLSDGIAQFAKTHVEFESASLTFQNDADHINPDDELAKAEPGLKGTSGE